MESITVLNPSSRFVSIFNLSIPRTKFLNSNPFSVFKFDRFSKFRSSSITVSCRTPWNPKTQTNKCSYRLPINPIWGFVIPFIHSIRDVAASKTRMGILLLRNTVEKWSSSCLREVHESYRVLDVGKMGFLQSGRIGMTLLSVTSTAKVRISPFMATLAANPTFVSAMLAWMTAQSLKMFLNFFVERKWDFRVLCSSGGMPSSHAALCTALTTSVALCHGVADSLFPVCLGFSLIVMYDAIGVRRHAGMHAEVLNMIVQDLFQGHPISEMKLKELLGHTPSQVVAGALLGITIACFCCQGRLAPV